MKNQRQGGFLITKIHQAAGRVFASRLKEHDVELNPAQGRIMFVLWQHGSMPIKELATHTSLGKSTLTSMLDRLEKSGYVARVHDEKDRRRILIQTTSKDAALQQLYQTVSNEMTELFYNGLSEPQRDEFEDCLKLIFANLEVCEADSR